MPELPEVETVRRALQESLAGEVLTGYAVRRPTFYRRPSDAILRRLPGRRLNAVRRRGKYLLLDFEGAGELALHLGMSGRLLIGEGPSRRAEEHVRIEFSFGARRLRFEDPRRFGRAACPLPRLGPEPLEAAFNDSYLAGQLRGRKAPIKALIMDQRVVAGIGNIYAAESLYLAAVRPGRAGGRLSRSEISGLCAAIKSVIARAVELGGSTLEDESFFDPAGAPGRAQEALRVYGRETGACGHRLKDAHPRIGGRTSLYCPRCQR